MEWLNWMNASLPDGLGGGAGRLRAPAAPGDAAPPAGPQPGGAAPPAGPQPGGAAPGRQQNQAGASRHAPPSGGDGGGGGRRGAGQEEVSRKPLGSVGFTQQDDPGPETHRNHMSTHTHTH